MINHYSAFIPLLQQILAAARAQGIDQRELARRAGIRAETLSRLKSRGGGDLDTLDRLARVAGLRLSLVADDDLTQRIEQGNLL